MALAPRHADGRGGPARVIERAGRYRLQPLGDEPDLFGPFLLPFGRQHPTQLGQCARSVAGSVDEAAHCREKRTHLSGRQVSQDRAAAGGQVRGQAHPDIGDQGDRDAGHGRLFLEQVQRLGAMQHAQMCRLPDLRHQAAQHRPGQHLQRIVAQICRPDLEGRHPEAVGALVREMHDEPARHQHVQQVVGRRARHPQIAGDRRPRYRARLAGQIQQQIEGTTHGRRGTRHRSTPKSRIRDTSR